MTFNVGDMVHPKPPHKHDHAGRELPRGKVFAVAPFDAGQRIQIEGTLMMFLSGYFERASDGPQ